jgi:hypothetical protein
MAYFARQGLRRGAEAVRDPRPQLAPHAIDECVRTRISASRDTEIGPNFLTDNCGACAQWEIDATQSFTQEPGFAHVVLPPQRVWGRDRRAIARAAWLGGVPSTISPALVRTHT